VSVLVGVLVLGLVVVLGRLLEAERRSRRLEARIHGLESRLERIELRLSPPGVDEEPSGSVTPIGPIEVVATSQPHAAEPIPVAPVPSPPPQGVTVHLADDARPGLEELIGGRWLLFAGIAAIILGISYFVKFAFDNGWISEPLRVTAGVVTGALLIGGGIGFRVRGVPLFGQALAGAGIVVLYVSFYAALHFYALIPRGAAFALMVMVTAGGAWLADRERSQPLAALALVAGFATPLLVGGDRSVQVVLFTYIAILIAGTAVIARRHAWPLLGAASYLCTFLLVLSWFFSSYEPRDWLRTELFLTVYMLLFGYLLLVLLRAPGGPRSLLAATVLTTAPLVYHLASIVLLNPHPAAWLVYVITTTVVVLLASRRSDATWARLTVLLLVGVPMLSWLSWLPYSGWYAASLVTVLAVYVMHLAAHWLSAGTEERLSLLEIVYSQVNGLLLPLTLYFFIDRHFAAWDARVIAALAAWNAGLAIAARSRAGQLTLLFVALAATLAASALVLAFDGPAVAFGWAAEGVLVGWLARHEKSRTLALGSAALIVLGSLLLLNLLSQPLATGETPVFNARALATALVIAMLAWLAWLVRDDHRADVAAARSATILLANVLALAVLSADLHAYFAQRGLDASLEEEPRRVADVARAEQVALSVTWALYAVALVFAGIRRRFAPARYLAILLFGVVVGKVLFVDIAGLDRLYRMLSVLGVGVLLLVASYLYQRSASDRTA
jgi:uncharacterized membrane protein